MKGKSQRLERIARTAGADATNAGTELDARTHRQLRADPGKMQEVIEQARQRGQRRTSATPAVKEKNATAAPARARPITSGTDDVQTPGARSRGGQIHGPKRRR